MSPYFLQTASILLSSLIEFLPLSSPSENGVLNHEEVVEIGNTFLKILTQCRHRVSWNFLIRHFEL